MEKEISRKRTETDQNIERKSENEEFCGTRALRLRQIQLKNQISVSGEEIKISKVEIR